MTHRSTFKKMEYKMAKVFGGIRIPLSGQVLIGGDVMSKNYLIECKVRRHRGRKEIAIKKEWLEKLKKEAKKVDKMPLLIFKFKGDHSYYVVLDLNDFRKLAKL
jgi:Holliday junction resolvase